MEELNHIKRLKAPNLNIIRESSHSMDIVDETTKRPIRYTFDPSNGVITEIDLATNKVIHKFKVFLTFESGQVLHPDILRSAIKTYHLSKAIQHNHSFRFDIT